jgi:WD40 repeat protein
MFQIPRMVRVVVTLSLLLSLASTGYAAKLLQTYGSNRYTAAQYSPDGSRLLVQDAVQAHVFDATTRQELCALPVQLRSVSYHFQTSQTVVINVPGSARLRRFAADSGTELAPIDLPVAPTHLEFVDSNHVLVYALQTIQTIALIQLDPLQVVWTKYDRDFTIAPNGNRYLSIKTITHIAPPFGGVPGYSVSYALETYDTATGNLISTSAATYTIIYSCAFSPDGQVIGASVISASQGDYQFVLINAADGSTIRTVAITNGVRTFKQFVLAADAQSMIGYSFGSATMAQTDLSSTQTSNLPITPGLGYRGLAANAAINRLLTVRNDGVVEEWDYPVMTLRGGLQDRDIPALNGPVALSPDGQYVVVNQQDGHILVFDAATGDLLHTWLGRFAADSVFGLAINHSPLLITSGTQAVLMDLDTGAAEHILPCPVGRFSADGRRVVVTTDTTPTLFRLYDVLSGNLVASVDSALTTSLEIQSKYVGIQIKNYATYDNLLAPDGRFLYARRNIEEEYSIIDTEARAEGYSHTANPVCRKIDLDTSLRLMQWTGPANQNSVTFPLPHDPITGQFGDIRRPSTISFNGKRLGIDKSVIEAQSMADVASLPNYIAALDETGSQALLQNSQCYDIVHGAVTDQFDLAIQYPTFSSHQNRLLFIADGKGYLLDLERTTETQIGGVHLHPLIDADGTFAPGQVLRVVWNLNLQTAGTAAQLELVNIMHPAQSLVLAQAWAPFGAATTWVTLPEKLNSGSYVLRARSAWNNALYVDSPPLAIAGNNGAGNWTQYE